MFKTGQSLYVSNTVLERMAFAAGVIFAGEIIFGFIIRQKWLRKIF